MLSVFITFFSKYETRLSTYLAVEHLFSNSGFSSNVDRNLRLGCVRSFCWLRAPIYLRIFLNNSEIRYLKLCVFLAWVRTHHTHLACQRHWFCLIRRRWNRADFFGLLRTVSQQFRKEMPRSIGWYYEQFEPISSRSRRSFMTAELLLLAQLKRFRMTLGYWPIRVHPISRRWPPIASISLYAARSSDTVDPSTDAAVPSNNFIASMLTKWRNGELCCCSMGNCWCITSAEIVRLFCREVAEDLMNIA